MTGRTWFGHGEGKRVALSWLAEQLPHLAISGRHPRLCSLSEIQTQGWEQDAVRSTSDHAELISLELKMVPGTMLVWEFPRLTLVTSTSYRRHQCRLIYWAHRHPSSCSETCYLSEMIGVGGLWLSPLYASFSMSMSLGLRANTRMHRISYFGLLGNRSGKGVPGDLEICGVEKESSYLDVQLANHVLTKLRSWGSKPLRFVVWADDNTPTIVRHWENYNILDYSGNLSSSNS